ncbi:MAG TPA: hypothetical protein VFZ10_02120 [Geminicoccaceae bacterium]
MLAVERAERLGDHLDRFDAYLNGELILTSRQPWLDGARELLRRGYPGDTLLTMRHAGKDYDCFVPLEIGYLAKWSISDSDRGGLKRIRWQPMPEQLKQRGRGDGNKSLHRCSTDFGVTSVKLV